MSVPGLSKPVHTGTCSNYYKLDLVELMTFFCVLHVGCMHGHKTEFVICVNDLLPSTYSVPLVCCPVSLFFYTCTFIYMSYIWVIDQV